MSAQVISWFGRKAEPHRAGDPATDYVEYLRMPLDQVKTHAAATDADVVGQLLSYVLSATWRSAYTARLSPGDVLVFCNGTKADRAYVVGKPRVPAELVDTCGGGSAPVSVFSEYTITRTKLLL